jgi:hypothetical protein
MRVGVLAVGLRGGVRPPAGCSRDAGRGAAAGAMRGGMRKRQNVAVWLRGGVRPPAGRGRDAGRGAQEAERAPSGRCGRLHYVHN